MLKKRIGAIRAKYLFYRSLVFILLAVCCGCSSHERSVKRNELRLNLFSEPPSLDPRKATDTTSMNVLHMLFEGLTRLGRDLKPYPAAAARIKISDDKRVYTFTLREAYWSNGDQVTAEDFVYAWQKVLDPKFPSLFSYKYYPIENAAKVKEGKLPPESLGIKILDPMTLEVKLTHPTPYFLELLSFPSFAPIHKTTDLACPEWSAEAGDHYISNGPFRLKKWEHDSEIIVEKNPYYWDADKVWLNRIHLSMIDDSTTEFYMYEMGELDWTGFPISNLPLEFIPALKKKGSIRIKPATAVYYYKINTDYFPLGNKKIRKALSYAINRKDIVEHIAQAEQIPATGIVPPMPGWRLRTLFKDDNKAGAAALFDQALQELNLKKSDFPTLTLIYNSNREHQKIAQAIQQQWQEALGIRVELENYDWKVYLSKVNKQDYQIARMGWIADFRDPIAFLEPFKYRDNPNLGGNNETGWEHPEYTDLLDKSSRESHPGRRADLLRQAESLLIDEMPVIPIYYVSHSFLKKPYVKGVNLSPLGISDFKEAYIDR